MADSAMKTRIITHMNVDHKRSITLYARHYNNLPWSMARTAKLEDLTLDHLILTSSFARLTIALNPPLASFSAARERLVAMHNECLSALKLSDTVVTTYRPPTKWWEWGAGIMVFFILTTFPFRASLHPDSGGLISQGWSLRGLVPWLAKLAWRVAPLVLPLVWVIHVAEVGWWMLPRLRRHGVELGSAVWWCWMVDCFLEGGGAWLRFDKLVKEMEVSKVKGKPVGRG